MFLPRWVQVVGGIFLALVALLCLWGSLALLSLPPKPSPAFFYSVVLLLFIGSCWVLSKGARLVAGRPVEGGLIGHVGLRVTAWLFLLIPVGAMLAGTFWEGPVVLRALQAATYVSIFFTLRRLAVSRRSLFLWSDAWILHAIGRAGESGPASLVDVLAAADAIQHALPTNDELHGALSRLTAAGYVRESAGRFALTDAVPAGGDYEVFLNSEPWTEQSGIADPRNAVRYPGLTPERIRAADDEYHRRGRATIRDLMDRESAGA